VTRDDGRRVSERKPAEPKDDIEPDDDAPDLLERVAEVVADLFDDDTDGDPDT
jgi:hypothetical protein